MKTLDLNLVTLLLTAALLAGCSTVPVTGRRQLNMVSQDEEMKLGLTSFEELKKELPVSKDASANALLQKVGKKIAAVAGPDMPNAQWEFIVFESKEANAFCLPGGKVGVYTGILPITKDEAGLATVVGHEVAHAVARHGGERMTQATAVQGVGQLASAATANAKPITQQAVGLVYGLGSQLGYVLPHSRSQESEADHIGLIYMARAGYDPKAAISFWERFSVQSGDKGAPWFLRTHPVDKDRIANLQKLLPEAEREFRGQGTSASGSEIIGHK
jgi:metalloendopeptidase OMA1, mitochondrial